jgi:hypothetical protein
LRLEREERDALLSASCCTFIRDQSGLSHHKGYLSFYSTSLRHIVFMESQWSTQFDICTIN